MRRDLPINPVRMPHAFVQQGGSSGPWRVHLLPNDSSAPPVLCDPAPTIGEACAIADAYIAKHFPGRTL